ncbi:MAG TPA: methyltransferase, partial [Nitrospirales bacterium]|nr:methyltransferase [Nitrospirales bacterium]
MFVFREPLGLQGWSFCGIGIVERVVGLWALPAMGRHQVKVFPEISVQGKLIVFGPYRWIRHPMYTSVLLVTLV